MLIRFPLPLAEYNVVERGLFFTLCEDEAGYMFVIGCEIDYVLFCICAVFGVTSYTCRRNWCLRCFFNKGSFGLVVYTSRHLLLCDWISSANLDKCILFQMWIFLLKLWKTEGFYFVM